MVELHGFLLADEAVVDPLALLLLPAPTHVEGPLSILFVICEAAYVVISICMYEPSIPVHLMVIDLALVDCTIINNKSTDTTHVICTIQLADEVWIRLALAILEVVVDFWDSAELFDVEEADWSELLPLLLGRNTSVLRHLLK